ncbi:MAG: gliding motility lipoprotein GldH [Sediminibacterium sp.]|jgi:gliding motility-associated lipoprotein GldH
MNLWSKTYFILLVTLFLGACQTIDLYEQTTTYPEHQWSSKQINQYQFNIADSNARYNMFFVIRHHNAYHYKNIWLQVISQAAGDSIQKQTININLADDMNGWLGSGMDDIYDHRVLMNTQPLKLPKGSFKVSIQQIMREDPLQNILTTGVRVEKAKP